MLLWKGPFCFLAPGPLTCTARLCLELEGGGRKEERGVCHSFSWWVAADVDGEGSGRGKKGELVAAWKRSRLRWLGRRKKRVRCWVCLPFDLEEQTVWMVNPWNAWMEQSKRWICLTQDCLRVACTPAIAICSIVSLACAGPLTPLQLQANNCHVGAFNQQTFLKNDFFFFDKT